MAKQLLTILGGSLLWFGGAIVGYYLSELDNQKNWNAVAFEVAKVNADFCSELIKKRTNTEEDSTKGEEE